MSVTTAHIDDNTKIDSTHITTATPEVLESCPRFRILLVGRSGVGKSSLINAVLGVDFAIVSHSEAGAADINNGLESEDTSLVLHDSRGLEAGERGNLDTIKEFITTKTSLEVTLKDKLHAIWLCIETPAGGKRVLERGDEELLKFCSERKLPIIVVFTQYDIWVVEKSKDVVRENTKTHTSMSKREIRERADELAEAAFERCIVTMTEFMCDVGDFKWTRVSNKPRFKEALNQLVLMTQETVSQDVRRVLAAQRKSVDEKVGKSIETGKKSLSSRLRSAFRSRKS